MTFQALDFTPFTLISMPFILAFLILSAIAMVEALHKSSRKRKIWVFSAYTVSIIIVAFLSITSNNVNNENKEKAVANIAQKYDIKDVNWDSKNTIGGPLGTRKEGTILLTTNNGEQYVFQYKVNKETSEPTLIDMPIQGGNTVDKEKSAEALLKK